MQHIQHIFGDMIVLWYLAGMTRSSSQYAFETRQLIRSLIIAYQLLQFGFTSREACKSPEQTKRVLTFLCLWYWRAWLLPMARAHSLPAVMTWHWWRRHRAWRLASAATSWLDLNRKIHASVCLLLSNNKTQIFIICYIRKVLSAVWTMLLKKIWINLSHQTLHGPIV